MTDGDPGHSTSAVKFSRRMFFRMESWFPTKRSGLAHSTLKFLNVTSRTPHILMPGSATISRHQS